MGYIIIVLLGFILWFLICIKMSIDSFIKSINEPPKDNGD